MQIKPGSTSAPEFNLADPAIAANLNDNHGVKENNMNQNINSFASQVRELDAQGYSVSAIRDALHLQGDPNGYRKVYGVLNHAKYAKSSRANGTRAAKVRGPEDMSSEELHMYLTKLQAGR
jgi:hypothetical protein